MAFATLTIYKKTSKNDIEYVFIKQNPQRLVSKQLGFFPPSKKFEEDTFSVTFNFLSFRYINLPYKDILPSKEQCTGWHQRASFKDKLPRKNIIDRLAGSQYSKNPTSVFLKLYQNIFCLQESRQFSTW